MLHKLQTSKKSKYKILATSTRLPHLQFSLVYIKESSAWETHPDADVALKKDEDLL